jgi:acetolactate synthase-1/2/3 large subunit
MIDAIGRIGKPQGMEYVMTRHESAAAHMADAWARVTGQPAVCSGTVGPGAVNLVPGIWVAQQDSVPMVVITPQIHTNRSYPFRGSQQQLDQHHLMAPITKWSAVVNRWERISELVQRAFRTATSGRPGPVHLDIPVDVMFETRDEEQLQIPPPQRYRATRGPAAPRNLVEEAARQLVRAERPMIHAGLGVLRGGAWEPLMALAEHLQIPVGPTVSARGVLPEHHDLGLIAAGGGALFAGMGADLVLGVGMEPTTLLPMIWNFKELEIRGSYGSAAEYEMALSWLAKGWVPVDKILTRDFPLERTQEAFELLEGPNEEGKVLIRINSGCSLDS